MRFRNARAPLFVCCVLGGLFHLQAGCDFGKKESPASQVWLRQLGTGQDDSLYAITGAGTAVYAAGSTSGQLPDFTGTTQAPDGYLVKLDASGQVAWQRQFGTAGSEEWRGVAADAAGNAYVVGYTSGVFAGQMRSGGDTDAVIARVRADGTLDWLRQLGTSGADYLLAVVVDSDGSAYAAGWTAGAFPAQTLNGASDGFAVKYRSDGTQEWLTQLGCAKEDSLASIARDQSGALYVTGWAADAVAAGQQPLGGRDAALYKLQPSGGVLWARQFGTVQDDEAAAVGVDASQVYVAGRTLGTLPGQAASGRLDALVASYDLAGSQRWLRQIGTAGDDEMRALAAAADGSGVYVGGYVGRSLLGAEWAGQLDAVYTKLTSDGAQAWVSQFGTTQDDRVLGMFSAEPRVLYVTGTVEEALPGQTRAGGRDAFMARYAVP